MATVDLWGELPDVEKIKTPFVILKEQAELLTEKTDGLLVGEVEQLKTAGEFECTLDIVAPTLNNYHYTLIYLHYDMTLYPLNLSSGENPSVSCSDEDEFKKELGKIFKSQETQNIISKLLAHVRSA
ncbi:hypothetical protein [Candidatus Electrothrix sp.]|uniref:hypothetical protein n=1 Tax=Candidatus Electrothrix sp. TaxID=2170559 RepID=UPI004055D870